MALFPGKTRAQELKEHIDYSNDRIKSEEATITALRMILRDDRMKSRSVRKN